MIIDLTMCSTWSWGCPCSQRERQSAQWECPTSPGPAPVRRDGRRAAPHFGDIMWIVMSGYVWWIVSWRHLEILSWNCWTHGFAPTALGRSNEAHPKKNLKCPHIFQPFPISNISSQRSSAIWCCQTWQAPHFAEEVVGANGVQSMILRVCSGCSKARQTLAEPAPTVDHNHVRLFWNPM